MGVGCSHSLSLAPIPASLSARIAARREGLGCGSSHVNNYVLGYATPNVFGPLFRLAEIHWRKANKSRKTRNRKPPKTHICGRFWLSRPRCSGSPRKMLPIDGVKYQIRTDMGLVSRPFSVMETNISGSERSSKIRTNDAEIATSGLLKKTLTPHALNFVFIQYIVCT